LVRRSGLRLAGNRGGREAVSNITVTRRLRLRPAASYQQKMARRRLSVADRGASQVISTHQDYGDGRLAKDFLCRAAHGYARKTTPPVRAHYYQVGGPLSRLCNDSAGDALTVRLDQDAFGTEIVLC
jgi:hypothetical protein